MPVIFDLPVPLAIKRAEEFARYISPLLQENCAKCHNGEYNGEFQLVSTKTRADRTPEAFRANLDATLRLVNPKNPSRSELLSSTLRPHGLGPRKRPIFPGSNDPTYSIIAAWVHNLCPPKLGDEANRAERGPVRTDRVETFAADRDQIGRGYQDGDLVAPAGRSPPRSSPRAWRRRPGSHRHRGMSLADLSRAARNRRARGVPVAIRDHGSQAEPRSRDWRLETDGKTDGYAQAGFTGRWFQPVRGPGHRQEWIRNREDHDQALDSRPQDPRTRLQNRNAGR